MVIGILPFYLFTFLPLSAQTPWAKKAAGAVFTLKTFSADGNLLTSSNGFFISENGEAVSSFTPFKGAQRAVVIDAQGKELPVECIIGANDMYDVAKFQVAVKKTAALTLAANPAANGETVWLLPYAVKKIPACTQGTVSSAEQFDQQYTYYTLNMTVDEQNISCPLLNNEGEVIGMLQPAADSQSASSYAVSVRFVADMNMNGLSLNNTALRATDIAKAVPDKYDEAMLSLIVASTALDAEQYAAYLDRFIEKFPTAADGYIYRARLAFAKDDFAAADEGMKQAVKVAEKNDDTHYQYAQMIYQKEIYKSDKPFEPWSLDMALQEAQVAYRCSAQPLYRQMQAQILYAQKKYGEAFDIYDELSKGELRTAETFYSAAMCKLQQEDQQASLSLLDSAVNLFTKPYIKTAAPFLLARAQALHQAGKYRQAVVDYNDYEQLMSSQLSADFYYLREQSEFAGHLYQQALEDIRLAVTMVPSEPLFYVEKANVELRVGLADDALKTAEALIGLDNQQSEGYLLKGIAQCMKGDKTQGMDNLTKAKELGNSQAQTFIDKYSK